MKNVYAERAKEVWQKCRCPHCGAEAGEYCIRGEHERPIYGSHKIRWDLYYFKERYNAL